MAAAIRRLLLLAVLAGCAAFTGSRSLKAKKVSCAQANEGDEIVFDCGGEFISTITFASYGEPTGTCEGFRQSSCHSTKTEGVIEERCIGQTTCMFTVSSDLFGGDPCPSSSRTRKLSAILTCGNSLTADAQPEPEEPAKSSYGRHFIFFVFIVFGVYLALGVAYNMRRHGATGIEALPHLEMWRDLPFLVRDGIFFSIDTIKSKGRAQYQSYL